MRSRRLVSAFASLALGLAPGACSGPARVPGSRQAETRRMPDQAWRSAEPASGASIPWVYPATRVARLGNGLSVLTVQRPTGTVSLRLVCNGGAAEDPPGEAGLSGLMARLLTEGTVDKAAQTLAIAAEELGADLSAFGHRDAIGVELEVLPSDMGSALALLAEVAMTPAFRAGDVARVKQEWIDNLVAVRQDPVQLAWLLGTRALLGPSLGQSTLGTPSQVRRLERTHLQRAHAAQVRPERCALLAAGPPGLDELLAQVQARFGSWSPSAAGGEASLPSPGSIASSGAPVSLVAPEGADPDENRCFAVARPGAVQTAIFVATRFPTRGDAGHEAREIMSDLFGGMFTSRLNLNLRERNAYTYGAQSSLVANRKYGAFAVVTQANSEATQDALREIFFELSRLRAPNSAQPSEIRRAVTDLAFRTAAHLEHTGLILDDLQEEFVFGLGPAYHARYAGTLRALGHVELARETARVPERGYVIVLVGDPAVVSVPSSLAERIETAPDAWLE